VSSANSVQVAEVSVGWLISPSSGVASDNIINVGIGTGISAREDTPGLVAAVWRDLGTLASKEYTW
jgi:hypothetical protein